jgi:hypothetical protein
MPGRYALFGSATQIVRFGVRIAIDANGTLLPGETAPTLPLPAAGSPRPGLAWDPTAAVGEGELPQDATAYRYIDVVPGGLLALYLRAPAATTIKLTGPLRWDLVEGEPVG